MKKLLFIFILLFLPFVLYASVSCSKTWVVRPDSTTTSISRVVTCGDSSSSTKTNMDNTVVQLNNNIIVSETGTNEVYKVVSTYTPSYMVCTPFSDPGNYDWYYQGQTTVTSIKYDCADAPPPLECPANASPDVNSTSCVCNSPYVDVGSGDTVVCKLPASVPDENSTNPDGSCKPGYSKNGLGVCKIDSDNDGVPDDEDAYPNDPSKSGGGDTSDDNNTDSNTKPTPICPLMDSWNCQVCICPKGAKIHYNTFQLPDGTFSMPQCSNTNTQTYCETNINIKPEYDCPNGYVPAPDYDITFNCIPAPSSCDYPNPTYFGYKFQEIVTDIFICVDLQFRYAGGSGENFNCPDGTVACYFNRISDENNTNSQSSDTDDSNTTASGTFDTNNTSGSLDSNISDNSFFDDSKVLGVLHEISDRVKSKGNNNHEDLKSLSDMISRKSDVNHYDLTNINGTLINKLDAIKRSIDSKSTGGTDMSVINGKLDKIHEDMIKKDDELPYDNSDLEFGLNNLQIVLSDSVSSLTSNYNEAISLINGTSAPVFSAGGSCLLHGSTKNIGSFTFDFSSLSSLRVPFQFFLNVMLAIYTIRLYSKILMFLTIIMMGVV